MFAAEDIRARARQQPFTPFRITTSSGESFEVRHSDLIWIGTRNVHIGTPGPNNPSLYDLVTRVAILHITSLQDLPVSKPQSGNGQQ